MVLDGGIVYEFLHVVTHPKVFPVPLVARDALAFVGTLLGSRIEVVNPLRD